MRFAAGVVLAHSNIREALAAASALLVAEGHPVVTVVDGDRSYQKQVDVFLARYVLAHQINGRRTYDKTKWEGRAYYRVSPLGVVAPPSRTAPHVAGIAADLGAPYNNRNTAAHKRLQQVAGRFGLDWTGRHFAEDWHWETTRGPGVAGGEETPKLEGFFMALTDAEQRELLAAARGLLSSQAQVELSQNVQTNRDRAEGNLSSLNQVILFQNAQATRARVEALIEQLAPGVRMPVIDEAALAAELVAMLAPLLMENLDTITDDSVAAIARAAADEQDRRARERLAGVAT